ncbi:MAG TPA: ATP-binding protein [Anaerolineales bacterium]|nr:ATP-binding protein [Anaerolineales bacterium]
MVVDSLRQIPLFSGLGDSDLQWLLDRAEPITINAGALLVEEGAPGDSAYIILDGAFEVIKKSDRQSFVLAVRAAGDVIGEMSLLDHAPRMASLRAVRDSRLLRIRAEAFHQLLAASPAAAIALLHTVSARLRENEAALRQNEKMAALGTLAAGLAHELNNPAAAAHRSAEQLRAVLTEWQALTAHLNSPLLNSLRDEVMRRAASPPVLNPMELSDQENKLQAWLEKRAVDQGWELAPTLAAFGWDAAALDSVTQPFAPAQTGLIINWLATGSTVYSLLNEIHLSAVRISEIVKAVKTYSYLDQAPIQEIDLHAGLEDTLVILRHKLKNGITVTRDYAPTRPRLEAYGSELNQVWTNILDNAIDALNGAGAIAIRTRADEERAIVEISDNGPGIPDHIQARIFEPFFTTKPPGAGTGLGLHIAYNIIQKHYGQIRVESQPGRTCFQIRLPIRSHEPHHRP